MTAKTQKKSKATRRKKPAPRRCGLCGATDNLTKTECCDQWICNDEDEYVLFSYARNSCYRNHRRFTLCGHHFENDHEGRWQDCEECRTDVELEMYVYYGTNEYNFEILKNPPKYEPTKCTKCQSVIVLSDGGYSYSKGGYVCYDCTTAESPEIFNHL